MKKLIASLVTSFSMVLSSSVSFAQDSALPAGLVITVPAIPDCEDASVAVPAIGQMLAQRPDMKGKGALTLYIKADEILLYGKSGGPYATKTILFFTPKGTPIKNEAEALARIKQQLLGKYRMQALYGSASSRDASFDLNQAKISIKREEPGKPVLLGVIRDQNNHFGVLFRQTAKAEINGQARTSSKVFSTTHAIVKHQLMTVTVVAAEQSEEGEKWVRDETPKVLDALMAANQ